MTLIERIEADRIISFLSAQIRPFRPIRVLFFPTLNPNRLHHLFDLPVEFVAVRLPAREVPGQPVADTQCLPAVR